jgi:copper chaperone CopZ
MSTLLRFKTNLKCGNCINAIYPDLNSLSGIISWKVDLTSRPSVLEVQTETATEQEIINAVKKAGYKIEPLNL